MHFYIYCQTSFYPRQKNYKQNCSVLSEQRLVLTPTYLPTYLMMSERHLHPVKGRVFLLILLIDEVIKREGVNLEDKSLKIAAIKKI